MERNNLRQFKIDENSKCLVDADTRNAVYCPLQKLSTTGIKCPGMQCAMFNIDNNGTVICALAKYPLGELVGTSSPK